MDLIIRKIRETDNRILAGIIRQVFIEHNAPRQGTVFSDPTTDDLFNLFREPRSILWVAVYENEVVGCCGIYPTEGLNELCCELVKFYLLDSARGKGIGKTLMQKSIESAIEFGYGEVYLESLPHFETAVALYEKEGFDRLDQPLGDSKHSSCTIWMIKKLLKAKTE